MTARITTAASAPSSMGRLLPEGLAREPAEQRHERRAEPEVEQAEHEERDAELLRRRHRLGGAHDLVDDPRLAADLRDDPAGLEGEEAEGRGEEQRPQEGPPLA